MFNFKELFHLHNYTSQIDEFLAEFDKDHPKLSRSQRKEIEKYAKIYAERDRKNVTENKQTFWDKF